MEIDQELNFFESDADVSGNEIVREAIVSSHTIWYDLKS